jgi:hypothetical protein
MEDLNSLFNLSSNDNYDNCNNKNQIFDEKKDSMLNYLPFNSMDNDFESTFNNIFNFDYNGSLFSNNKNDKYDESVNTKQILDRLNSFDDTYFKKIVVEDNKVNSEKISFKSNLMIAEKTLPGLIISFMHDKTEFVSEEDIIMFVTPKFNGLRKTNGSFYQVSLIYLPTIRET